MKNNILKQWQSEHRKQQRKKKHQFGWYTTLTPNVGNNEYNNAVFNNMMGSGDTDTVIDAVAGEGMGESIIDQQNIKGSISKGSKMLVENNASKLAQLQFEFGPYTFEYEDEGSVTDYFYIATGLEFADAYLDLYEHNKVSDKFLDSLVDDEEKGFDTERADKYFLDNMDSLYDDDKIYSQLTRYFSKRARDKAYEDTYQQRYNDNNMIKFPDTYIYYEDMHIEAQGSTPSQDIDDYIDYTYLVKGNEIAAAIEEIIAEDIPDTYDSMKGDEIKKFIYDNWDELVEKYNKQLQDIFYEDAIRKAIDEYEPEVDSYFNDLEESLKESDMDIKSQIKFLQDMLKQDKEALEFAKTNKFDDIVQASISRRIKSDEQALEQLYKESGYDEESVNKEEDITDLHTASLAAYNELKKYKKGTKEYQDAFDKWYALHKELTKKMYKGNSYIKVGPSEITVQDFPTSFRVEESLKEGGVKELIIEVEEAGGIETWMIETEERYDELVYELKYLKNQAPKEINRGGSFDSQLDIDEAIAEVEAEIADLERKYKIVVGADL